MKNRHSIYRLLGLVVIVLLVWGLAYWTGSHAINADTVAAGQYARFEVTTLSKDNKPLAGIVVSTAGYSEITDVNGRAQLFIPYVAGGCINDPTFVDSASSLHPTATVPAGYAQTAWSTDNLVRGCISLDSGVARAQSLHTTVTGLTGDALARALPYSIIPASYHLADAGAQVVTPPPVTPPAVVGLNVAVTSPSTTGSYTTDKDAVTVKGTAGGGTIALVASNAPTDVTGTKTWSQDISYLSYGDNNLTYTVTNSDGETAKTTFKITRTATGPTKCDVTSPATATARTVIKGKISFNKLAPGSTVMTASLGFNPVATVCSDGTYSIAIPDSTFPGSTVGQVTQGLINIGYTAKNSFRRTDYPAIGTREYIDVKAFQVNTYNVDK